MKVRKKPIIVEAFKVGTESPLWFTQAFNKGIIYYNKASCKLTICTLEGHMEVNKGDWIIQGIEGEIYPCKSNIFEKTFEILGDDK